MFLYPNAKINIGLNIINKLKGLPILEYEDAIMTRGATNLFIPDKPSKILK